jgi:hypothetical protein
MNEDLFRAILAMDSYNRGYNAGITGLSDDPNTTQIGNATVAARSSSLQNSPEVAAGFYAIAYNWNGETVISYRGCRRSTPMSQPFPLASPAWAPDPTRVGSERAEPGPRPAADSCSVPRVPGGLSHDFGARSRTASPRLREPALGFRERSQHQAARNSRTASSHSKR